MTNQPHEPQWVSIDPTGGDPFMGGPVSVEICNICKVERAAHPATGGNDG